MPIAFKKMQMNINNNVKIIRPAPGAGASAGMHIQKNGAGLQSSMVTRISGVKSGCGCGK